MIRPEERPEDRRFVEAILAAPEDDGPRLVYADHLLESGDWRLARRGELIIAQCTLAREPRGSDAWRRARQRESEIIERVRDEYSPLPAVVEEYKRGFPSFLQLGAVALRTEHADKFQWLPIETLCFYAMHDDPRDEVTLGDLAWVRRRYPWIRKIFLNCGDDAIHVAVARLPPLDEGDETIAWDHNTTPHAVLHDATVRLALSGNSALGVEPYLGLRLPALEELCLSNTAASHARRMLENRTLRWLMLRGNYALIDGLEVARSGAFANLATLDADLSLDDEIVDAIHRSSITDLTLRYHARPNAIGRLGGRLSQRVEQLALRYQGPYDQNVFNQPIGALNGHFAELETLSLERFYIDGAVSRIRTPKLAVLELNECVVAPEANAWLRSRGLLDAGRAREL